MRNFYQPPRFHRCMLALVAALVPAPQRPQWRSSNSSMLASLWTLIQRGEFPRDAEVHLAMFCRECMRSAVFTRFSLRSIRAAAGHPVLPIAVLSGLLLLTVAGSGGLPTLTRLCSEFGTTTDFVFGHAFVLILGGVIALQALVHQPYAVHGWPSGVFLGAKTTLAMVTLICAWMETAGAAQRVLLHHEPWWVASRVVSTLAFLFACGWLVAWCVSDQRHRCPSCLRRLSLPVSAGSYASVLDPATTILVCPKGHGCLTAPETEFSPPDQWTHMDASWSIFMTPPAKAAGAS